MMFSTFTSVAARKIIRDTKNAKCYLLSEIGMLRVAKSHLLKNIKLYPAAVRLMHGERYICVSVVLD